MSDLGPVNTVVILLIVLGLFACMIALIEIGRWLGRKHREKSIIFAMDNTLRERGRR